MNAHNENFFQQGTRLIKMKMRMQGTVNENAASICRICQRSDQLKIKKTISSKGNCQKPAEYSLSLNTPYH